MTEVIVLLRNDHAVAQWAIDIAVEFLLIEIGLLVKRLQIWHCGGANRFCIQAVHNIANEVIERYIVRIDVDNILGIGSMQAGIARTGKTLIDWMTNDPERQAQFTLQQLIKLDRIVLLGGVVCSSTRASSSAETASSKTIQVTRI